VAIIEQECKATVGQQLIWVCGTSWCDGNGGGWIGGGRIAAKASDIDSDKEEDKDEDEEDEWEEVVL